MQEDFNVNFDFLLEQSNCTSVGYSKRLDDIKMHGATIKITLLVF